MPNKIITRKSNNRLRKKKSKRLNKKKMKRTKNLRKTKKGMRGGSLRYSGKYSKVPPTEELQQRSIGPFRRREKRETNYLGKINCPYCRTLTRDNNSLIEHIDKQHPTYISVATRGKRRKTYICPCKVCESKKYKFINTILNDIKDNGYPGPENPTPQNLQVRQKPNGVLVSQVYELQTDNCPFSMADLLFLNSSTDFGYCPYILNIIKKFNGLILKEHEEETLKSIMFNLYNHMVVSYFDFDLGSRKSEFLSKPLNSFFKIKNNLEIPIIIELLKKPPKLCGQCHLILRSTCPRAEMISGSLDGKCCRRECTPKPGIDFAVQGFSQKESKSVKDLYIKKLGRLIKGICERSGKVTKPPHSGIRREEINKEAHRAGLMFKREQSYTNVGTFRAIDFPKDSSLHTLGGGYKNSKFNNRNGLLFQKGGGSQIQVEITLSDYGKMAFIFPLHNDDIPSTNYYLTETEINTYCSLNDFDTFLDNPNFIHLLLSKIKELYKTIEELELNVVNEELELNVVNKDNEETSVQSSTFAGGSSETSEPLGSSINNQETIVTVSENSEISNSSNGNNDPEESKSQKAVVPFTSTRGEITQEQSTTFLNLIKVDRDEEKKFIEYTAKYVGEKTFYFLMEKFCNEPRIELNLELKKKNVLEIENPKGGGGGDVSVNVEIYNNNLKKIGENNLNGGAGLNYLPNPTYTDHTALQIFQYIFDTLIVRLRDIIAPIDFEGECFPRLKMVKAEIINQMKARKDIQPGFLGAITHTISSELIIFYVKYQTNKGIFIIKLIDEIKKKLSFADNKLIIPQVAEHIVGMVYDPLTTSRSLGDLLLARFDIGATDGFAKIIKGFDMTTQIKLVDPENKMLQLRLDMFRTPPLETNLPTEDLGGRDPEEKEELLYVLLPDAESINESIKVLKIKGIEVPVKFLNSGTNHQIPPGSLVITGVISYTLHPRIMGVETTIVNTAQSTCLIYKDGESNFRINLIRRININSTKNIGIDESIAYEKVPNYEGFVRASSSVLKVKKKPTCEEKREFKKFKKKLMLRSIQGLTFKGSRKSPTNKVCFYFYEYNGKKFHISLDTPKIKIFFYDEHAKLTKEEFDNMKELIKYIIGRFINQ